MRQIIVALLIGAVLLGALPTAAQVGYIQTDSAPEAGMFPIGTTFSMVVLNAQNGQWGRSLSVRLARKLAWHLGHGSRSNEGSATPQRASNIEMTSKLLSKDSGSTVGNMAETWTNAARTASAGSKSAAYPPVGPGSERTHPCWTSGCMT